MNRHWFLSFFIIGFLLAACINNIEITPTPFPVTGSSNPGDITTQLLPVDLTELIANPKTYEGALIQVNGRYRRLLPRVCSGTRYAPPTTWNLTVDELTAYMSGFDNELRSLLPENTTMSVNGIWRQWHGPVGCGKEATPQDVWYLEVREIISPNPITSVTLTPTPSGEATQIADSGTPTPIGETAELPVTPVENAENPPAAPAAEATEAATMPSDVTSTPSIAVPILPSATPTPTLFSSGDGEDDQADDGSDNTAAPQPGLTATATAGSLESTPTPTNTDTSGAAANTPIPTSIPLTTPTVAAVTTRIIEEDLVSENNQNEQLAANEIHIWEYEVESAGTITITLAAEPNVDIIISVFDEDSQAVIDEQNLAPPGELEVAVASDLDEGTYEFHIKTVDGTGTHYFINVKEGIDEFVIHKGFLEDGDEKTTALGLDRFDSWYFFARKDDVVTFSVDPHDDEADLWVGLYNNDFDPDAEIVFADSFDLGATEEIIDFSIPIDGIFRIEVFEFSSLELDYTISLFLD